jgi:hypothetical protein
MRTEDVKDWIDEWIDEVEQEAVLFGLVCFALMILCVVWSCQLIFGRRV